MTDQLRVAMIQADLYWEDVTANLSSLEEKIAFIDGPVDLIVLPEMFNSGFTMNPAIAEPLNFTTTRWMQQVASRNDALVIGSFAVKEEGKRYNRLLYVFPDGQVSYYDKRHLFRMGDENQNYTMGGPKQVIGWRGWKICGLVCYDLRFPVWSRNQADDAYDLLIYVANWPAKRSNAWNILLRARAIENQCYVIGVNRVGKDGVDISYQGDSALYDFLGEPLLLLKNEEVSGDVNISLQNLKDYKNAFPAHLDADPFYLTDVI